MPSPKLKFSLFKVTVGKAKTHFILFHQFFCYKLFDYQLKIRSFPKPVIFLPHWRLGILGGHSIIMLSQNWQHFDPLPLLHNCSILVPPSNKLLKLYINFTLIHPLQKLWLNSSLLPAVNQCSWFAVNLPFTDLCSWKRCKSNSGRC